MSLALGAAAQDFPFAFRAVENFPVQNVGFQNLAVHLAGQNFGLAHLAVLRLVAVRQMRYQNVVVPDVEVLPNLAVRQRQLRTRRLPLCSELPGSNF